MGLQTLVTGRGFKNFMAKLYGIGASVVILGALFKITHITGANEMLFIGLITEAVIFFFSAFEPPHVEPDWSLVYPELAGMYHGADKIGTSQEKSSVSKQLDKMLDDADIKPHMIERLGQGLQNLSQSTEQMNDLSDMVKVNSNYAKNVEGAAQSVSKLSASYDKTQVALDAYSESLDKVRSNASALDIGTENTKSYQEELSKIAGNLSALNQVYANQLQTSSAQVEANEKIQASMEKFLGNLQASIETTK
ncbi:MAG: gliding motility protein GldL, partial [Bacteroidetes bacterium]